MDYAPCRRHGERLNPCARMVWDQHVDHLYRLDGPWLLWRVQGRWLIGPRGVRCTPETLTRAWYAWLEAGLAVGRETVASNEPDGRQMLLRFPER